MDRRERTRRIGQEEKGENQKGEKGQEEKGEKGQEEKGEKGEKQGEKGGQEEACGRGDSRVIGKPCPRDGCILPTMRSREDIVGNMKRKEGPRG